MQSRGKVIIMKKSIYKIENKINHKIYIGQSIDPFKRFSQHCYKTEKYRSLINDAIKRYGKENFSFEILEHDIENYNEREQYWIEYYDSNNLNKGYNLTIGGEDPPIHKGLNNINTTHTLEQVLEVKYLLKNTDMSLTEIAQKTGYADKSAIDRINKGIMWNDPDEEYPLRKLFNAQITVQERWEQIVDLLLMTDMTQKEIAKQCNVGRTTVTAINRGQNGQNRNDKGYKYPLRENRDYNNNL